MENQNSEFLGSINSISDFFKLVIEGLAPTTKDPLKWMFRGHADTKYELKPSIGRLYPSERFDTLESLLEMEKLAFQRFELMTYEISGEHNQFATLAVAQHHGLSTRLLDWTESPLAALFFAVEETNKHKTDGALFATRPAKVVNALKSKLNGPFDVQMPSHAFITVPSFTKRIRAQEGLFQIFKDPTAPYDDKSKVVKFFIPKDRKRELKADLSNLGINYHTLFPDLDGIAKNINYVYLNQDY